MTEKIYVGIFLNFRTLANVGLSGWFYSEKATGKNLSYLRNLVIELNCKYFKIFILSRKSFIGPSKEDN